VLLNSSTDEAFIRELHSFAVAIQSDRGVPFENTFADAGEDIRLLGIAMRLAANPS
jgi:hypothetical protein